MSESKAGDGDKTINKQDGGSSGGTDPNKNGTSAPTTIDLSKIGDEDFNKIFDDPRLFKHPRFKTLGDKAKRADELEEAQRVAAEKALAEQGKYKELAETKTKEAEAARNELAQAKIDQKIIMEAQKAGVVDLDVVTKLVDRTEIKLAKDGTIEGVDVAVKTLLEAKPYLRGKNAPVIGSSVNPGSADTTGKRFKLSQIQDVKFYRENEQDILQSIKLGLVENDVK